MAGKTQRELAFLLTGRDVSATKAMKGVNKELGRLGNIASKAGSNVARNVERGVLLGTTAAVGAVGFAIKEAQAFESSSTSVRKTVEKNADAVIAANRALAREFGFNINALNEISAAAGAMDVPTEAIDEFTRTIQVLSETADDVTIELGAESFGHLRTNLQLTGKDITELGDLIVHLGNNGASTEGEILAMAEAISGAAGVVNASKEDVVAWASAMASAGEEAEAGGSAIQRVWIDSATWIQEGGTELKTLAKISGVTVAQFKRDFGKDAPGTLAKFITKLGKLEDGQQLAVLAALGWDDIRITRAMTKLLGNTDNLNGAIRETGSAAGAMEREFSKRMEDSARQVQVLEANFRDAAITVGTELLPIINELAREGVDWISTHQDEIQEFGQGLASNLRDAVTWARSLDWDAIGAALGAGASAAKTLVDAFASAPPWVQQLLVGGFVANKLTGGAVGDLVGELGKGLIKGVLGMNAAVVNINAGVVNGGGGLPGPLGKVAPVAVGAAGGIAPAVGAMSLGAVAAAGLVGAAVLGGIQQAAGEALRGALKDQPAELQDAVVRGMGLSGIANIPGLIGDVARLPQEIANIVNPPKTVASGAPVATLPGNAQRADPRTIAGPIVTKLGDTNSELLGIQSAVRSAQTAASLGVARAEGAEARAAADQIATTRSESAGVRMAVDGAAAATRTVPPAVAQSAALLAGTTRSELAGVRMAAAGTTRAVNAKRWQITIPVTVNSTFAVSGRDLFSQTQKQGARQTIR